jgi:hypothetical protein
MVSHTSISVKAMWDGVVQWWDWRIVDIALLSAK